MYSLAKWKPEFCPSNDLFRLVPIWVRLPGLPLKFGDERVFRWIGHSCGHFIKVELSTSSKAKLGFARFCVNVGMNKPLTITMALKIKWGAWSQIFLYKNVSPFRQNYNMFGHLVVECRRDEKLKEKVSSPGVEVVGCLKEIETRDQANMASPKNKGMIIVHYSRKNE